MSSSPTKLEIDRFVRQVRFHRQDLAAARRLWDSAQHHSRDEIPPAAWYFTRKKWEAIRRRAEAELQRH